MININADYIFGPDELPRADVVTYTEALQRAILNEQVRREAKRRVDADERPATPFPTIESLRDRLSRPHEPLRWAIDNWQPHGSNVMIAAPFKGSKTTLRNNYIRCRVDGDPFLVSTASLQSARAAQSLLSTSK